MPEHIRSPATGREDPSEAGAGGLLIEAGAVLSSSLDPPTTMGHVARLTIPRLADLCVIDLLGEDNSIRDVAVAAADPAVSAALERLRREHPVDPHGLHPVARVIASGEAELLAHMSDPSLRSYAQGTEHERFMLEHDYRSAIVAPLLARGRTLGALSVLRFGEGHGYGEEDLELVRELARRAALAIDNAQLYSNLRSVERRLTAILENLAEAITVVDVQGWTIYANQAAADLFGARDPAELTSMPPGTLMDRFLLSDEDGRELNITDLPEQRLFRGEPAEPVLLRAVLRETGEERWLRVRSSPVGDPDGKEIRYAANVFEDITDVKGLQLMESFMAEASRLLASGEDYRMVLQRIAALAVPQVADMCAIEVVSESGEIELVAIEHRDRRLRSSAELLRSGRRPRVGERGAVAEVVRDGRSRLLPESVPDDLVTVRDPEHRRLLEALDMRSAIVVPLAAPARTLGAILLTTGPSGRRLTEAHHGLAIRIGRRAGTTVESARLHEERSRIASILQSALLPDALPRIEGARLGARYRPAGELNRVGGDFYDVIPYGQGGWLLAIGDVCGKGPQAARVTALTRYTLRTAAILGQEPVEMLRTLHRALRLHAGEPEMCTVCLVLLEPAAAAGQDRALTIALAGHPQPLLVGADGSVRKLGEPGTLLGLVDPLVVHPHVERLGAGETLLLYTDGVSEAGRAGDQLGERGLIEVLREGRRLPLGDLLLRIEHAALEHAAGGVRDDLALLALRLAA